MSQYKHQNERIFLHFTCISHDNNTHPVKLLSSLNIRGGGLSIGQKQTISGLINFALDRVINMRFLPGSYVNYDSASLKQTTHILDYTGNMHTA